MIRWNLMIDEWNFPISSSWISSNRNVTLLGSGNEETMVFTPIPESEYDFYLRTKGLDWVRTFYRPTEEGIREDFRELDQEGFQYDDEGYYHSYEDRYEGSFGGRTWSYSDETLPERSPFVG